MEGYSYLQTICSRGCEATQIHVVSQSCSSAGSLGNMKGWTFVGSKWKGVKQVEQWKRELEWKDTWEALGVELQGVDRKGGNKKATLCKTVWFGKARYEWGQEHCCLVFTFLLSQAARSHSLCPFLNDSSSLCVLPTAPKVILSFVSSCQASLVPPF